jgi:thymidylate kinase
MDKNIKKGLFIVFEGIDMSGKTSIAKGVVEELKNKTDIVYQKGICSKTWIGRISCCYPSTVLFLIELIYLSIKNYFRTKKGTNVIQDRYFASIAFYLPITKKLHNSLLLKIGRMILPTPDMLIYCTAPKKTIIQRLKRDCEKNKYHKWLIDNPEYINIRKKTYKRYSQQFEGDKIVIDTSICTLKKSIAEISKLIQSAIDK